MRRVTAVLLLLLAGCSSGSTPQAEPSPTPTPAATTEAPSPTASPTPTPTASPTPSPTPRGLTVPAADGDVDGDGTRDVVQATATLLKVTLSSTGKPVTAAVHSDSPNRPAVLGYADVDRDGRSEVFLETAEGASTSFATPYRYDGKALVELQLDGGPARLGMGGGITHGDGFVCLKTGLLEIRQATSDDGETFTVQASSYRISGSQLVLVGAPRTSKGKQGDPAVEASYTADCGSVTG